MKEIKTHFVHIMQKEKFTISVSEFYNSYLNNGEHEILYINKDRDSSNLNDSISITQREILFTKNHISNYFKFIKMIKGYDYIVFHSFFFGNALLFFLSLNNKLLKKVVWIEWGADLYTWNDHNVGIMKKIMAIFGKKIRSKCNSVVCIFPPDCDFYHKEFPNAQAKVYYAPYCGPKSRFDLCDYNKISSLVNTKKNNDDIYIMVGHRSDKIMNHIDALNKIKKFKNHNIKIFLPLNYGDMAYGDTVQDYAEKLFPGKVIVLRKMMPADEYFKLLDRIDIAIFDTYRQVGLGNINRLIFKNVKVYMPKDSVMYKFYLENGVDINALENICTFDDFIKDINVDSESFCKFLDYYTNMENKIALWRNIYDDLKIRRNV